MFIITKEFAFSAAHQLVGLAPDHPCMRVHGHNYIVKVELASETLNSVSFVRDYGDLKVVSAYLDKNCDHRHLNDVFPDIQTSAEELARRFFEDWKPLIPELSAVSLSETPKTWATYRS